MTPLTEAEVQAQLPGLIDAMRPGDELRVLRNGRTFGKLVRTDPHGRMGNAAGGDWALVELYGDDDPPVVIGPARSL